MPEGTIVETDLLQHVMYLKNTDGSDLTLDDIVPRMMALIFASMVSTAGHLNHLLVDLAGIGNMKMPAEIDNIASITDDTKMGETTLLEMLYEEQETVMKAHDNILSKACIDDMKLLDSTIRESLRFSTPTIQQARLCVNDGLLGEYAIEKGTMVVVSGVLAHSDPKIFEQPEQVYLLSLSLSLSSRLHSRILIVHPLLKFLSCFSLSRLSSLLFIICSSTR